MNFIIFDKSFLLIVFLSYVKGSVRFFYYFKILSLLADYSNLLDNYLNVIWFYGNLIFKLKYLMPNFLSFFFLFLICCNKVFGIYVLHILFSLFRVQKTIKINSKSISLMVIILGGGCIYQVFVVVFLSTS